MGSGFSKKIVKESIQFERNQDPKKAMGIGTVTLKEYFLSLFPGGLVKGRSTDPKDLTSYALIKEEIMKPSTQILRNVKKSKNSETAKEIITIKIKPTTHNWFFMIELKRLIKSGPDIWHVEMLDDNSLEVEIYI